MDTWAGLLNPTLAKCDNAECNSVLLWADNSTVDFDSQEFGATYVVNNAEVKTRTCNSFKHGAVQFGDTYCTTKLPFICQKAR